MSRSAGITGRGRAELAAVLASSERFITPADVSDALRIDPDAAAKRLSRWAREGWVRRVRRGLYIGVPVDAQIPRPGPRTRWWSPRGLVAVLLHWLDLGQSLGTHRSGVPHHRSEDGRTGPGLARSVSSITTISLAHIEQRCAALGSQDEWHGDTRLSFADPARTVIDVLDDPGSAGGIRHAAEITGAFLDEHGPEFLSTTGTGLATGPSSSDSAISSRRSAWTAPTWWSACKDRVSAGISALDPGGPEGGRRTMRWGLRVNVAIAPQEPS